MSPARIALDGERSGAGEARHGQGDAEPEGERTLDMTTAKVWVPGVFWRDSRKGTQTNAQTRARGD
jgi:hypothetical protein